MWYKYCYYTVAQKGDQFYFYDNFVICRPIFIFFTVNFRKELRKNKKYHLPLNLLPHWRTTLQKVSVHARGLLVYKGYDSGSYLQVTNAIIGVY